MEKKLLDLVEKKNILRDNVQVRAKYGRATAVDGYVYATNPVAGYREIVEGKSKELDAALLELLAAQRAALKPGPSHFRRENVWCWGGPTPLWSGSMEPDTSVKGAKFFGFDNVVYVYGPVDEHAMELHKECGKVICQVSQTSRTAGAQDVSDVEMAERISRLSLKYPNIKGAMMDDFLSGFPKSPAEMKELHDALCKYNPDLELCAVIYSRELDAPLLEARSRQIDVVNLWIADKSELANFDLIIEKCRARFPGCKIMLGVFMQDIGLSDLGYEPAVCLSQLSMAREAYRNGKIQDVTILGDREIPKFPELAAAIRDFFAKEFASL